MSLEHSPNSDEEIGLKEMAMASSNKEQQKKQSSNDSLSIALPPSDPPPAAAAAAAIGGNPAAAKASPPNYYLPNSPTEMFLAYENEKKRMRDENEKNIEKENLEEESKSGKEADDDEAEDRVGALNRRQTRLYRTLVWTQFGITVFTCIFILVIMVLVAFILVMLQRTIDRADHAIRDNPVSQMYMKLKNAVNKINI